MKFILTAFCSCEGDVGITTFVGNTKKECYKKACDSYRSEGPLEMFEIVESNSNFKGETADSDEKYYEDKLAEIEDALTEDDVEYSSELEEAA